MPDFESDDELRAAWRSQPTEPMETQFGSQRLRQRAKALQSRSRREWMNSIVVAGLIAAGSAYGSLWTDSPVARASFAAAAVWALMGQFFLHRTKRPLSPPEGSGLRTSLDSCRQELERHLRFDRGVHLWLGGPLILSFGTLLGSLVFAVGGTGMLVKMVGPVAALLITWALGTVLFRSSRQREFQRALDDLDQIARER